MDTDDIIEAFMVTAFLLVLCVLATLAGGCESPDLAGLSGKVVRRAGEPRECSGLRKQYAIGQEVANAYWDAHMYEASAETWRDIGALVENNRRCFK